MQIIEIKRAGDNAWPELQDATVIWLGNDSPSIKIVCLDRGMTSGKPSMAIRLDLPDGKVVVAETSVRAFQMAAAAVNGLFGEIE